MPTAVKISDDLAGSARDEARVKSRSLTQQVEHWARIGRVVERSGAIDPRRVRAALAAELAFDDLGSAERAAFLGELEALVVAPDGDPAVRAAVLASGVTASVIDSRGHLVSVGSSELQARTSSPRRRAAKRTRSKRKK